MIDNGAAVNDNSNDTSPLYVSVVTDRLHIAKYLIDNGADINKIINKKQLVEVALHYKHIDIAELLLKSMKNVLRKMKVIT